MPLVATAKLPLTLPDHKQLPFARFASVVQGLLSVLPMGIAQLAKFMAIIGADGAASGLTNAAEGLAGAIEKIGPAMAIAGVAAAVGLSILIDKLVTAKDAGEQFAAGLQSAVQSASNVNSFQVLADSIAKLNTAMSNGSILQQEKTNWNSLGMTLNSFSADARATGSAYESAFSKLDSGNIIGGLKGIGTALKDSVVPGAGAAAQAARETSSAMQQLDQQAANVAAGGAYLAKTYGTTFVGALALADEANVKLVNGITGTGQAAMVARMQIASVVTGYKAMGQSAGEVGADMTALAIQSGLAGSQVANLNSAWDSFISGITGGTGALSSLTLDLTNLATGTNQVTNVLGKTTAITLSIKQFANSLNGLGASAAQAFQNFNKGISDGEAMMDWLRTAGTEGALSASQFKAAGLDMASALVPLAAQSKTAQAEVMGLVQEFDPAISTFGQLKSAIASSGASFSGLNGIVGAATQKMANMQSVAQTLGNVLNSALLSALSAATVSASGAGAAMQKYAQDLMNGGAAASGSQAAYQGVMKSLENLGLSAKQAAALIAQVTSSLNAMPTSKTITITTDLVTQSISSGGGAPVGVRAPGHAAGTPSAAPGWSWVGEAGPELIKLRGGETILPNSVSMGYANGAGDFGGGDIHLYIDGRELSGVISKRAIQTQRRTGSTGMTRRAR